MLNYFPSFPFYFFLWSLLICLSCSGQAAVTQSLHLPWRSRAHPLSSAFGSRTKTPRKPGPLLHPEWRTQGAAGCFASVPFLCCLHCFTSAFGGKCFTLGAFGGTADFVLVLEALMCVPGPCAPWDVSLGAQGKRTDGCLSLQPSRR